MKTIVEKYYENLASGNIDALQDLYHPFVTFEDPVFHLQGKEVGYMWKMLFANSKKNPITITFQDIIQEDETHFSALWIADYHFSQTGNKVTNIIHSHFTIQEGKIYHQKETFNLQLWIEQAFKPYGKILYFTPFFIALFRKKARKKLNQYIQKFTKL